MTLLQLNSELYKNMAIIAEDESLMRKLVKYARKLAQSKTEQDDALMTEEEFFTKIDHSLEQATMTVYRLCKESSVHYALHRTITVRLHGSHTLPEA